MFRPTLLTLATSLLASCGSTPTSPTPDPIGHTTNGAEIARPLVAGVDMITNDRCQAVRDVMVDTVVHQLLAPPIYNRYGYNTSAAFDRAEPMSESKGQAASPGDATAGPSHYTTTNVQERGVDEADLVKTDGKYIYTLRNNELLIAKSWPVADTAMAARVVFAKLQPLQLYLHGDTVIVQGTVANAKSPTGTTTRVLVIDVSDRTKPQVGNAFDIDGTIASSRVVGDDFYAVQTATLPIPAKLTELALKTLAQLPRADQQSLRPWEVQARLAKSLSAALHANLSESDITSALPQVRTGGLATSMSCSDLYVPQNTAQLGITAVARINLGAHGASGRTDLVGAMVSGGQVYASPDALYVSGPAYTWNEQGVAAYQTAVHKFSLSANQGRPTYVASGAVDGQLLNQFSMSEHQGDLRIATTDWNWNGSQGGNHLFVMRPEGRALRTIGSIKGLAKGERIYAGRMFGDKGYLVTFRQTDPLFTLDLSDPTNPKVAGELKINGYSSYLHPMGNDLLLAIGQDANDNGVISGLQLQIFDVSNPAKPTRKFQEKLSSWSTYSGSAAESDHHAFNFDPVSGTLSIPTAGSSDGQQYSGLVVYGVDGKRGFTLYGRVSHRQLATEALAARCAKHDPWDGASECDANRDYQLSQYSQIDRSIVIDRHLVSLGMGGLEIHSLEHLGTREARLLWPTPAPVQSGELAPDVVIATPAS